MTLLRFFNNLSGRNLNCSNLSSHVTIIILNNKVNILSIVFLDTCIWFLSYIRCIT